MLTAYAAGFYTNLGNYYSFGATKFIPELSKDEFEQVIQLAGDN